MCVYVCVYIHNSKHSIQVSMLLYEYLSFAIKNFQIVKYLVKYFEK